MRPHLGAINLVPPLDVFLVERKSTRHLEDLPKSTPMLLPKGIPINDHGYYPELADLTRVGPEVQMHLTARTKSTILYLQHTARVRPWVWA